MSLGRLFCNACRETISVKRSTVANNIKSTKHMKSKIKLSQRQSKDTDLLSALRKYNAETNPVGQTFPDDQRLYRQPLFQIYGSIE